MLRGTLLVASAVMFSLTACKSDQQKAAEEAAKRLEEATKNLESGQANVGDAMAALGAAMGAATGGRKVESVDFRQLRDMLPNSIAGLPRVDISGEKTAAMGMDVSTANADYSNNQGRYVSVKVTDMGSLTGMVGLAAYGWALSDIDRESGSSYEKTVRIDGHKALEKFDRASRSGDVTVLVADRFIVEANGNDVDVEDLRNAVRSVNLGRLDGMKGQGVQ